MSNAVPEYGFTRAPDEVLAVRNQLADRVIQALQQAGLPAFRDGAPSTADRSGAVVHVDPDAETVSAPVSVGWRCDPAMVEAAVDSLTAGHPTAPAVRYPGTIGLHMRGALIKILLSSGLIATPENDTTNPDHVLVFGTMSDLPPALRPTFIPEGP
ncbi:hypothetical protein R6V09_05530 [Streptomyces sp. W16]|uniref:hypothetical protein n=1 Tax=Streptomyces sp. W16 TaxID=3076631 RepID=UPI00295B5FFD|nr:hypothetical protein [Streptomyces sp. W16]MDV9169597.1 hypothetical protein [Streptomyces sp. W16]